ncbi:hypothetical protein [Planococcus wigleyi]|uniref:hypothetical protein n=1 Tax=Planococcus wigleyi TaxID=2762216 RepID=UPI00384E1C2C
MLDFFAGSGTTGHAVMEINKEDDGQRNFILCTNNENNICKEVTYERLRIINENEFKNLNLKYYQIDFIPTQNRFYYEYADQLLERVRELVELENAINFTDNKEIAIILSDEELEGFMQNLEENKDYRVVYLGHNVLATGEQEKALFENKIKINVIPDYYFQELRGL